MRLRQTFGTSFRRRARRLVVVAATISLVSGGAAGVISIAAAPAGASTVTTIVGAGLVAPGGNPAGPWGLEPGGNTGTDSFVSSPPAPSSGFGTGSLAMGIAVGQHESFFNYSYGNCANPPVCNVAGGPITPIGSFTALGYSAYRTSGASYPTFNIEVESAGTTGFTSFVFIPTTSLEQTGQWQTWDAMDPTQGAWWSSKPLTTAPFGCNSSFGCSATWAQVKAGFPNAVVVTGLGTNVGTDTDFQGFVDGVTVGVSGATTIYDFEPDCTTTCYVSAASGHDFATGSSIDPLKTVQEGVNKVQAGGTVIVAAGTYTEQVVANKAVTITGAGQASTVIQGPTTMANSACIPLTPGTPPAPTRAVVTICGSPHSTVTMTGVTISGGAAGEDASASCSPLITGAWVSDGETLNISQSTVTNVYNSAGPGLWGCQQGVGIRAGSDALSLTGNLIADHVTVLDYQKGGIVVDGAGSSTTITNSTIEGNQLPGLSPTIAMNGVEIARGATGSISSSTVSGNECDHPVCGPNPITQTQSGGILVFDSATTTGAPAVSVTNNNITGNDMGIYSDQLVGTSTISGNTINANRDEGVYLDEGTASVTNNAITNNGSTPAGVGVIAVQGVQNSQGDVNATLTGNTISGNPTGIEAVDACPGAGCNTTDSFTVHVTAMRNAITSSSVLGVDNVTPAAPYGSTVNATCNWWGSANGPGPVGPGSGTGVSTGVTFDPWLVTSSLSGVCATFIPPPTITQVFDGSASSAPPTAVGVSFTPGPDGGNPFTSFTVTCSSLNGGPTASASGSGSPIFVGGLASTGVYQCTVTATNALGTSVPSAPFTVVLGASGSCPNVPTAPTMLSRGPGNSSITVSWAPATGCVAGYVVTPFIGGVAQVGLAKLIPGPGTTTVMKGLTNGVTYQFTVAAENGAVVGPASVLTGPITAGAPSATTVIRLVRVARGALKVTFRVPANNGAPITGYAATCTSHNGGVTKSKAGRAGPLTVAGLSAGKVYTCTVKATNKRGTGPASPASAAIKA